MKELDIVATLQWRGLRMTSDEFKTLSELDTLNLSKVHTYISHAKSAAFIKNNPGIWEKGRKEILWLQRNHCRWTIYGDKEYPDRLYKLQHAPLILTYRGSLNGLNKVSLGVVGSRKPNIETLDWLDEYLLQVAGLLDLSIVSGGARGVDQKAHALALRGSLPTLCFLPAGLNNIYPQTLFSWIGPILAGGGALISQFSPFEPMFKSHFHSRNLLIASVSDYLLIGEARRKSGTLLTAKMGLELGVPIGVVPCSPMEKSGLGGLDLIFDGAQMIRDHIDLGLALRNSEIKQYQPL